MPLKPLSTASSSSQSPPLKPTLRKAQTTQHLGQGSTAKLPHFEIRHPAASRQPSPRPLSNSANGLVLMGHAGPSRRRAGRDPLLLLNGLSRNVASMCPSWSRAPFPSTPPMVPAPSATGSAPSTTSTPPKPSPTGPSRCSMAPWAPAPRPQYLLRLMKLAAEKVQDRHEAALWRAHQASNRSSSSTVPPHSEAARTGFHGIFAYLRSNMEETKSEGYREYMMQYMSATELPACHGARLRPESLAVTIPVSRRQRSRHPDGAPEAVISTEGSAADDPFSQEPIRVPSQRRNHAHRPLDRPLHRPPTRAFPPRRVPCTSPAASASSPIACSAR